MTTRFTYNALANPLKASYMDEVGLWACPPENIVIENLVNSNFLTDRQINMSLDPTSASYGVGGESSHLYHYTVDAGFTFFLSHLTVVKRDTKMDPSTFGGLPELPNGVLINVTDVDGSTSLLDLTHAQPLKCNADWGLIVGAKLDLEKATG